MPFEPVERVAARTDGARASPGSGFGGASIGGLFSRRSTTPTAIAIVRPCLGRSASGSFDIAPLYGYGAAERRMGARPRATRPRDEFVLSTKVGRLVRPRRRSGPAADIDRQALRRPRGRVLRRHRGPVRIGLRLQRRRRPAVDRGEPRAARPRPDRHRPDPRPGRPLAGGHRRGLPGPGTGCASEGVDPGDRRRHEPVGDARPVRARDRHRRLPARRSLHAARPGGARRAAAAVRRARDRGPRRRGHEQRRPGRSAAGQPRSTTRRRRRRSSSGRGGSARSAPGTASRSGPPRSSSRSPTRPSHRSSPASGRSPTSTSTRRCCAHPIPAALWDELRAEGLLRPTRRSRTDGRDRRRPPPCLGPGHGRLPVADR